MNIAFERVEYTISNSISTSSNVCIQLTNGTLERNVTVTIGAKFGGITSGINYVPLLRQLTFAPNDVTFLCINLTGLVDIKSSGKAFTLFLTTSDKAVHLTQNTTVINIQSQCKFGY